MAVKLTNGIQHSELSCGCHMARRVASKRENDFVRVDVSADCGKPDHREEMGDGPTN